MWRTWKIGFAGLFWTGQTHNLTPCYFFGTDLKVHLSGTRKVEKRNKKGRRAENFSVELNLLHLDVGFRKPLNF